MGYLAICDDGHDDVCYPQDVECPACRIRDELTLDIESLREELEEAKDQIEDLISEPVEDK